MGEDAEGPDVGRGPDLAAAFADLRPEELGRGVVGGGESGGVGVGALQLGGHVEVGEPGRTVLHQQHVGGLEVAVDPAGAVQLGQSLTGLREQRGALRRVRGAGEERGERALGPFQYEDGGAVEFGAVRVVDGEGLVHPDEPRACESSVQLDLALGEFTQMRQLTWRTRAGGQELQRRGLRQALGRVGAPGLVDAAERARGDRVPHLPGPHPVPLGHRDRVPLRHRAARLAGSVRTSRSSSRTRSNRRARETRDSFLPLRRGPVSAVSGPGLSRSFTAR